MPRVHEAGKDRIIMATEEELSEPSEVKLAEVEEPQQPGLILEDGSINWNCPCLGGMATGPCGVQFREAFSCFHYSTAEPKGSNCVEAFTKMQDCMQQYPALYGPSEDEEEEGKKEDQTNTKEEQCDPDKGSEKQPSAPSPESKQQPTETAEKK